MSPLTEGNPHMTRAEILAEASSLVCGDRDKQHGDAHESFGRVAALWSADLGVEIGPVDVARLLALFKLARTKGNPALQDSWVDAAGYAALGGEIAAAETPEPLPNIDRTPQSFWLSPGCFRVPGTPDSA